jgi:hypothetical protein
MSRHNPQPFGKGQAARPNAAEAKREDERYRTFHARLERIAAAVKQAGREDLADRLADLGQRVQDREITLDEGQAELRDHEAEIRAMLKR